MPHTDGISEGKAIYKAGKLIRIKAEFEGEKIRKIRITGDFFLYPEEAIERIESSLKGLKISDVKEKLEEMMKDMEYEGISPEALAKAIEEAWKRRA